VLVEFLLVGYLVEEFLMVVLVLVVPIALEQYFTNRENAKGSK